MELSEVLYLYAQDAMKNGGLTDLTIGTVTGVNPLEITTKVAMAPLRQQVLFLTEPVIEKKIPVLQHNHVIHDTYTGGGESEDNLLQNAIVCYEDGKALPVQNGYIILNRALEVGDKVLLLRVMGGQRFIVLSRVFGGG